MSRPNGYGTGYGGRGTVTCSGQITATFDWVPDNQDQRDTPPVNVLVRETCTATWKAYDFQEPLGYCTNDLDFNEVYVGEVPGASYPPFFSEIWTSTGTRYRLVPGANVLEVHCNPSASAYSSVWASAEVWYSCSVAPVTVDFAGGIGPTYAQRYLVGIPVTATLSTNPINLTPAPLGCTWCVPAKPFKDFNPTPTNSNFVPFNVLTEKDPTVNFLFGEGRPAAEGYKPEVWCSATLTIPAGCKPEGGLPVDAMLKCTVEEPDVESVNGAGAAGKWPLEPPPAPDYLTLGPFTITARGHPYALYGVAWASAVVTPTDWVTVRGVGTFGFAQLITAVASFKKDVQPNPIWYDFQPSTEALDRSFLYPVTVRLTDNPPDYLTPFVSQSDCDGTWLMFPDNPGIQLDPAFVMEATEDFTAATFLIYKPGGTDSRFVPLRRWPWHWAGTAIRQQDSTYQVSGTSDPATTVDTARPTHPTWTQKATGTNWVPR